MVQPQCCGVREPRTLGSPAFLLVSVSCAVTAEDLDLRDSVFCFIFFEAVSSSAGSGWPRTHCVVQADFELVGIPIVYQHTWQNWAIHKMQNSTSSEI